MLNRNIKWSGYLLLLFLLLCITIAYSLGSGELKIPFSQILSILDLDKESMEYTILYNIRLPRIILGFAVGGALSLSGVVLQGIFRNPLVEPYTLGISGGAALGVAFTIVLGLQQKFGLFVLPTAGFTGALATIISVYFLSLKRGQLEVKNMLLVGVMISFVASSGMMFLMSTTTSENLHGIVFWIMGSLDETDTTLIYSMFGISLLGLFTTILFSQPLNALRLGEEKARYLGVNTDTAIRALFIITSLLTGVSVAISGVIGFVGLVVPHLIRLWLGMDYRILLPGAFLGGASFMIFSDTIARTIISPNELPIGVITGIVGGSVFIVVLSRYAKR